MSHDSVEDAAESFYAMASNSQTLRFAIKAAKRAGLLQEFRDGYRRYRKGGDDVVSSAWCALYDWDMLDIVETVDGPAFGLKGIE